MAKRIRFESDFVEGVIFDSEEEMTNFDSLINSKDYYLECCKKYIEDYHKFLYDNIESVIDLDLDNGKIIITPCYTFSQHLINNVITVDYIYNTQFSELSEDMGKECFDDEEILNCISEYVADKIEEFADDINKLVQFELNLS